MEFGDGSPPQGLSEARRGSTLFSKCGEALIRREGAPSGAAAFIIPGGMGASAPIFAKEGFP